MKIVAIKCITGEMVIAKEEERMDGQFVGTSIGPTRKKYTDLRVVSLFQDPRDGQHKVQMGAWIPFVPDQEVTEDQWERMTLMPFNINVEVENIYLQNSSRFVLG